jgi:uncharacterized protein YkwD
MSAVVRNLVMVAAAALPTGVAVGSFFATAPGVTVVTPGGTTTTPSTPSSTGTGSGSSSSSNSGVVISNSGTNCTVPNNNNVQAASAFTNDIMLLRSSAPINSPVQLDSNLNGIAASDIVDMAANNYLGTTNSKGQTLIQRVQAAVPSAKAAAEIIVKGCYGNNTDVDIINLIVANASAVAILQNPNWTHFGISEQPDFSHGSPDRGIYWVVIFAQE